ncbi:TIR domain-containing protein [Rhizobium leguminosarum]|uniref:toll/interleukin-1 receptor domain-containing protein n=1 Tax=Rhizobium leguminosarum TaxID=384 RepID=UPI00102F819A|nr:TIR domain-containing protein [Rhizobium leguminosarum]TBD04585.1 TIR domain-containing protein [Rhizobium leguminosarum]
MKPFKYEVALSFAGEDRPFVSEVAEHLRESGVGVFYDRYEEVQLWGKDLYTHLSSVYRADSRYTVIFVSRHYVAKLWTNHELRSAQARAFADAGEYVLPARFDDTPIPGLLDTVGYVDLKAKSPRELSDLIIQKLRELPGNEVTSTPIRLLALNGREQLSYDTTPGELVVQYFPPGHSYYDDDSTEVRHYLVVNVRSYVTIYALLTDIYKFALASFVRPLSYGVDWILVAGRFNTLYFVPPRWVDNTRRVLEEEPEWCSRSPIDIGLLLAVDDPFRDLRIYCHTPRANTKLIAIGTNRSELATLIVTESKSYSFLMTNVLEPTELREFVGRPNKYQIVFEDWLSCSERFGVRAFTDNGKDFEGARRLFRRR